MNADIWNNLALSQFSCEHKNPQVEEIVCAGKSAGPACSFKVPHETVSGQCKNVGQATACVPS